jgi:hypothetical protein
MPGEKGFSTSFEILDCKNVPLVSKIAPFFAKLLVLLD